MKMFALKTLDGRYVRRHKGGSGVYTDFVDDPAQATMWLTKGPPKQIISYSPGEWDTRTRTNQTFVIVTLDVTAKETEE